VIDIPIQNNTQLEIFENVFQDDQLTRSYYISR